MTTSRWTCNIGYEFMLILKCISSLFMNKPYGMASSRLPAHGKGEVVIENINDEDDMKTDGYCQGSVSTLRNSYPLKILVPANASMSQCKWIYPINFGGGLVAGDCVDLAVHVKKGCCALLSGQESTKVYHSEDNLQSSQTLYGSVEDGGLLCVLSDPVVCYKDADFMQTQEFRMSSQGNLVYLDWLIGGRVALNELWQFKNYQNKTDIYVEGKLVYRDNYNLHNNGIVPVEQTMKHYQVVGSCVLLGNKMDTAVKQLQNTLSRKKDLGEGYDKDLTCSTSPLCYTVNQATVGGVYIRFMASSSKKAYDGVISYIVDELKEAVGGNPFEDKY